MKTAGIIAEYNPFHNGHAYQLAQVRRQTNADYIVIAMSGNFVQRGAPAIVDKYARARMALETGADLVLELPAVFSVSSAEYFACAGVTLLAATGVVDTLCYGCESIEPSLLTSLATVLTRPDKTYQKTLTARLRHGLSYPRARQQALCDALPEENAERLGTFLSSPNNILALEYEKAIRQWNQTHARRIEGCAIRRVGDDYHDTDLHSSFASATALRRKLSAVKVDDRSAWDSLSYYLPQSSAQILKDAARHNQLMLSDDFSGALYAALLACRGSSSSRFADATPTLLRRIDRNLNEFVSFTQFADLLKTKELTHARIRRVLTHIMLGFSQEDQAQTISYLRIIGFRKSAGPLLTAIRQNASTPLISKVADAGSILQKDIYAADLYRGIRTIKSGIPSHNEYTQPLILIP